MAKKQYLCEVENAEGVNQYRIFRIADGAPVATAGLELLQGDTGPVAITDSLLEVDGSGNDLIVSIGPGEVVIVP